jgi:hypothetical protein
MEKTLATLRLIVSDETGPSGLREDGDNQYTITLRRSDSKTLRESRDFIQTTLAHELGHFVAKVTHDDSHHSSDHVLAMIFGPQALMPAEEKAWKIAHKIHPTLNRKIEAYDMGTYVKGAKQWNQS